MRSFDPDEPIEPILPQKLPDQKQVKTSRGSRLISAVIGPIVLLLTLIVAGGMAWLCWIKDQKLAAFLVGLFDAIIVFSVTMSTLVKIQSLRIARAMRKANRKAPPANQSDQTTPDADLPRATSRMRHEVYLLKELPPLSFAYRPGISADRNILGLPPKRILYLYNFFSSHGIITKLEAGWRRFGPVYFLGSPGDIGMHHALQLRISKSVKPALLTSNEAIEARLAAAAETPLPPGDKGLTGCSFLSGGYPHHHFLCTDANWRHAVIRLASLADAVVIDATEYRPERRGLNWELGCVLDHVPAEKFIVLMDSETDQVALGEHFRQAWSAMRGGSPNDRPDVGPVRFVLLTPCSEEQPPPKPPDPYGVLGKMNWLLQQRMEARYPDDLAEDRMYGFFPA